MLYKALKKLANFLVSFVDIVIKWVKIRNENRMKIHFLFRGQPYNETGYSIILFILIGTITCLMGIVYFLTWLLKCIFRKLKILFHKS